jgi:hypothetical protein
MTISLRSAALALATFAALPAIANAASPLQCPSQSPELQEVAISSAPSRMVPFLFDPADPATAARMGGMPLVTVLAPSSARNAGVSQPYPGLVRARSAQSESHVPAQNTEGRIAAQSNQNVVQQGTWLG